MDSIWDFFRAASPWVAMGLLAGNLFCPECSEEKER